MIRFPRRRTLVSRASTVFFLPLTLLAPTTVRGHEGGRCLSTSSGQGEDATAGSRSRNDDDVQDTRRREGSKLGFEGISTDTINSDKKTMKGPNGHHTTSLSSSQTEGVKRSKGEKKKATTTNKTMSNRHQSNEEELKESKVHLVEIQRARIEAFQWLRKAEKEEATPASRPAGDNDEGNTTSSSSSSRLTDFVKLAAECARLEATYLAIHQSKITKQRSKPKARSFDKPLSQSFEIAARIQQEKMMMMRHHPATSSASFFYQSCTTSDLWKHLTTMPPPVPRLERTLGAKSSTYATTGASSTCALRETIAQESTLDDVLRNVVYCNIDDGEGTATVDFPSPLVDKPHPALLRLIESTTLPTEEEKKKAGGRKKQRPASSTTTASAAQQLHLTEVDLQRAWERQLIDDAVSSLPSDGVEQQQEQQQPETAVPPFEMPFLALHSSAQKGALVDTRAPDLVITDLTVARPTRLSVIAAIELKRQDTALDAPKNLGQLADVLIRLLRADPRRRQVVGVLTNHLELTLVRCFYSADPSASSSSSASDAEIERLLKDVAAGKGGDHDNEEALHPEQQQHLQQQILVDYCSLVRGPKLIARVLTTLLELSPAQLTGRQSR